MKLIIFGIIVLFTLQGCSSLGNRRVIKSCDYYHLNYKKNEKQCKKDKKILAEILGKGSLEAENKRKNIMDELTVSSIIVIPLVVIISLLSK